MPKVSVIIPLYNQGHFLKDAIRGLRNQTYGNWEAIIVNDGSSDGSEHVAKEFATEDPRIILINQKNGGLSAARNTGIDHSTGELIALLDSDDYFLPTYLTSMAEPLLANPARDVSWCQPQVTNEILEPKAPFVFGKPRVAIQIAHKLLKENPALRLVWDNPLVPCGQVWRAEKMRDLRYDENLRSNEDWDILCRLQKNGGRFEYVDGVHSYYRRHGNSLNNNQRRMAETRIRCGIKNYAYFDDSRIAGLSRLALSLGAANLELGDALLDEIPGTAEENIEVFHEVLASEDAKEIAVLWCGGAARMARPQSGTRASLVIREIRKILPFQRVAWKLGFSRVIERSFDKICHFSRNNKNS